LSDTSLYILYIYAETEPEYLFTIKLDTVLSYVIKLCSANSVKSFTFIHIM